MRSLTLDNMEMAEVLDRAWAAGDGAYWLRVAKTKLAEYRRYMPKLERFTPGCDWRTKAADWQTEIDRIERSAH